MIYYINLVKGLSILFLLCAASPFTNIAAQSKSCWPDSLKEQRRNVTMVELANTPYNGIVRIRLNNGDGWGTGALIADNMIITARHVLATYSLKSIGLQYSLQNGDTMIRLSKRDFDIIYNKKHAKPSDIDYDLALIKIKNPLLIKWNADKVSFKMLDFFTLKPSITNEIHFTSYPFDKVGITLYEEKKRDTLVESKTSLNKILFNERGSMMGYLMYTCNGDSGGPLWVEIEKNIYLVGICQGWSNIFFRNPYLHNAVLLNTEKVDWINSYLNR
ncbi:trypsin-like serine peptidase [Chitinophagaceae bacterium LWZ2-11]